MRNGSSACEYQRRGRLTPKPCANCGAEPAQKHHENYAKPLEVTWLCRPCHLALHRGREQQTAAAGG